MTTKYGDEREYFKRKKKKKRKSVSTFSPLHTVVVPANKTNPDSFFNGLHVDCHALSFTLRWVLVVPFLFKENIF